MIKSAFCTVVNLCAIITTVLWTPKALRESCIEDSVSVSRDEVASSNKTIGASLSKHLAMATLCFSPPLNFNPLSPTLVANPSGNRSIKLSNLDNLVTAWILS
mmetsp:Transcript_23193/g.22343  ORF Transcript_23193/g.22343 Transcript_23193/m.22343 type:complete len:103 (+) Transcript_23193:532-840(+)